MTEELEQMINRIMHKHRDQGGTLVWHKNVFDRSSATTPARQYLLNLGMLEWVDTLQRTTALTPKGWEFESMERERSRHDPQLEKLNLELIKLRNEVSDYAAVKQRSVLALIIAMIAAGSAVAQLLI